MTCPACQSDRCDVIDSRPVGTTIRRRRECAKATCRHRFTTYETYQETRVLPSMLAPRLKSIEREAKDPRLLLERTSG